MPNLEDYEREWRNLLLSKLEKIEEGQKSLTSEVAGLKLLIPSKDTMNDVEDRLRKLETFKTTGQTLFFVIQAGIAFVGFVIEMLIYHFSK